MASDTQIWEHWLEQGKLNRVSTRCQFDDLSYLWAMSLPVRMKECLTTPQHEKLAIACQKKINAWNGYIIKLPVRCTSIFYSTTVIIAEKIYVFHNFISKQYSVL